MQSRRKGGDKCFCDSSIGFGRMCYCFVCFEKEPGGGLFFVRCMDEGLNE